MYESRRDSRKKQRLNRLLNIAIIIVIALIGVFAYQIFKPSNEMTTEEDSQEQLENEQLDEENVATEDDEADNGGTEEGLPEEDGLPEEEGKVEEDENQEEPDENEEDAREEEEEDDLEPVEDGEWQPIGTDQTGAYSHDFNEGSLNWQEKVRALSYATGIPEGEMTVWWLGNGGSSHRVSGVVAGPDGQKYEVLMEFIEGQGWLPLDKSETN